MVRKLLRSAKALSDEQLEHARKLFDENLGWAESLARKAIGQHRLYQVGRFDLIELAREGLFRAAMRYALHTPPVAFRTYAARRIVGNVRDGYLSLLELSKRRVRAEAKNRREARPVSAAPRDAPPPKIERIAAEETPESLTIRRLDAQLATALLARLPERERELVTAAFLHEERLEDIARRWGVSQARVSQIKQRALVRLRAMLR